jgi:methyl-accepting chemotaxis protein
VTTSTQGNEGLTTRGVWRIFDPADWIMRKLKLAQKFAVIAVVLLVPLGFVLNSYLDVQNSQIGFSAKERVGVAAIKPTAELLVAVGDARSAFATKGVTERAGVQAAIARVDAELAALGNKLDVGPSWTALKDAIATADSLDAWAAVGTRTVALVAEIADVSNLTLDPDLDSYYVMDAFTVKIPVLLDTSGLAADLASADAAARHDEILVASGTAASTMVSLATDAQKAIKNTKDPQLSTAASAPVAALTASTGELGKALAGAPDPERIEAAARAVRGDAIALSRARAPRLDHLLQVRVAKFDANKRRVELITAAALVLALWLFLGFYRSVTTGVKRLVKGLEAASDGNFGHRVDVDSSDEVGSVARALRESMERTGSTVAGVVRGSSSLSESSERLATVSQQMSATAEETAAQAATVSAAAEQVSMNVQSVSAGAEELGASIQEIAKNASDAARVAAEGVAVAEATNETVVKLGASSAEIGAVIKVITLIAEQTNMLALNATIEAARAGDAGKGFAVVANEVKALARKTARSSEEIGRKIETIQSDTHQAVSAIGEIASIIGQINDIQTVIAASVEEQAVTTREISRSVSDAAAGSSEIAHNITGVAEAARTTTTGAVETLRAADELTHVSRELTALVAQFGHHDTTPSGPESSANGRPQSENGHGNGHGDVDYERTAPIDTFAVR